METDRTYIGRERERGGYRVDRLWFPEVLPIFPRDFVKQNQQVRRLEENNINSKIRIRNGSHLARK